MLMVALRTRVSHFALCPANLPVLQATGHVGKFQIREGESKFQRVNLGIIFWYLEVREGLSNQL